MIEILLGCVCVHLLIIGIYLDKIARALKRITEYDEEDAE